MHGRLEEELGRWVGALVSVQRLASPRLDLLARLVGVSVRTGGRSLCLQLERGGRIWLDGVLATDFDSHSIVIRDGDGVDTRLSRLLLPPGLADALHLGQADARQLDLPTLAQPFGLSRRPRRSRRRPRAVVVWVESATFSRLLLWWVCASFGAAAVWVVPLPQDRPSQPEVFGLRLARELMSAAPTITRLRTGQVRRLAANWTRWAAGDARFRAVPIPQLPAPARWVGEIPGGLFDAFPRHDHGFALAPFDAALLRLVADDWSSSLEALVRLLRSDDDRLMQLWGDRGLHARLHAWSRWRGGRYVQRRPSRSDRAFSRFQYRLTDAGRALLDRLPTLAACPPLRVGGFAFYGPASWVLAKRGPIRVSALPRPPKP